MESGNRCRQLSHRIDSLKLLHSNVLDSGMNIFPLHVLGLIVFLLINVQYFA